MIKKYIEGMMQDSVRRALIESSSTGVIYKVEVGIDNIEKEIKLSKNALIEEVRDCMKTLEFNQNQLFLIKEMVKEIKGDQSHFFVKSFWENKPNKPNNFNKAKKGNKK